MSQPFRPTDTELDPVSSQRAAQLSALLAETDDAHAIRRSAERMRPMVLAAARTAAARRQRVRWLSAAALALIVLSGVAVPPVRALVIEQVRNALTAIGLRGPVQTGAVDVPATPTTTQGVEADVRFSFAVPGSILTVDGSGAHGTLLIRRGAGAAASIEAAGAPDARFVVMSDGVRIDSETGTEALFTLHVPARVREVRVQTRGQSRTLLIDDAGARVDLQND